MRKNPMARALRLDKMSLAALDWTLASYLSGSATRELPVLRQLLLPADEHEARTRRFATQLREGVEARDLKVEFDVIRDRVPVGGGSLPGFEIDSWALALRVGSGAETLAARLRGAEVPVLSRVRDGVNLIDLRAVDEGDAPALLDALWRALH
jgi:L-seryl-tRNA(Ser) seleniumtransferase